MNTEPYKNRSRESANRTVHSHISSPVTKKDASVVCMTIKMECVGSVEVCFIPGIQQFIAVMHSA